ncbi:MAG: hypothetical protein B9S36_03060 [Verrucomicrobiia bacterium Tous-C2TDCM]|nr:MAG: hypothetical protein B9S36_03060 [Verrucomicrobiae bacterium Tous-C2TDCM]
MKASRVSLWIAGGLFAVVAIGSVVTSRAGYETAKYEVVEKDGDFEIRRYEAHVVVATPMAEGSQNGSFGKLFQYISGKNLGEKKIEMTTPVFMPASDSGEPGEMQFVVPAEVAEAGAPAPSDASVKLGRMEAGNYAAIRYSGVARQEDRKKHLEMLRARLLELKLEAVGNPIYAGYDPPWTPGPMRRNEVILRVK